jgi:hypothetical protein
MNKQTIFFCLAFFACIAFSAPNVAVGIEGGYTFNYLQTSEDDQVSPFYWYWHGMSFGVPVLVALNEHFALGSGLRYIQKNYSYDRYGGWWSYNVYANDFLQVPVFTNFTVGKNKWRLFFEFGTTLGFWLRSAKEGNWRNVGYINIYDDDYDEYVKRSEAIEFDSKRDNRFEAALFAGIGTRYALKYISSFISAQFHYGLTDLQKKNYETLQTSRYNNTITLQTGFLFGRLR